MNQGKQLCLDHDIPRHSEEPLCLVKLKVHTTFNYRTWPASIHEEECGWEICDQSLYAPRISSQIANVWLLGGQMMCKECFATLKTHISWLLRFCLWDTCWIYDNDPKMVTKWYSAPSTVCIKFHPWKWMPAPSCTTMARMAWSLLIYKSSESSQLTRASSKNPELASHIRQQIHYLELLLCQVWVTLKWTQMRIMDKLKEELAELRERSERKSLTKGLSLL